MLGWLRGRSYRVIMRIAHRFNWHYAPPCHPEGDTLLWCQWCGLRYRIPQMTLPPIKQDQTSAANN